VVGALCVTACVPVALSPAAMDQQLQTLQGQGLDVLLRWWVKSSVHPCLYA
jgi:hypothetical protein